MPPHFYSLVFSSSSFFLSHSTWLVFMVINIFPSFSFFSPQNVLRELEQKKPQLDELVQTAESIKDGAPPTGGKQLPAQGKHHIFFFQPYSRHSFCRCVAKGFFFCLFSERTRVLCATLKRVSRLGCAILNFSRGNQVSNPFFFKQIAGFYASNNCFA